MVWGKWTLNTSDYCLEHPGLGCLPYKIPLEEFRNSAIILDWIFQLSEKTWMTSDDKGDLVQAILDIFGRDVCAGGVSSTIDPQEILSDRYGMTLP